MVRLMLVLAPVMCILGGIAVSGILTTYMGNLDGLTRAPAAALSPSSSSTSTKQKQKEDAAIPYKNEVCTARLAHHPFIPLPFSPALFMAALPTCPSLTACRAPHHTPLCCPVQVAVGVIGVLALFLITFSFHCTWVTAEAYSSPSIVLSAGQVGGQRRIFDDFREAYYWLRMNTDHNAKVRVCVVCVCALCVCVRCVCVLVCVCALCVCVCVCVRACVWMLWACRCLPPYPSSPLPPKFVAMHR